MAPSSPYSWMRQTLGCDTLRASLISERNRCGHRRVLDELAAEDLDRHDLVQEAVVGLVDDPHPSLPQEGEDLVPGGDHRALGEGRQVPAAGQARLGPLGDLGAAARTHHGGLRHGSLSSAGCHDGSGERDHGGHRSRTVGKWNKYRGQRQRQRASSASMSFSMAAGVVLGA